MIASYVLNPISQGLCDEIKMWDDNGKRMLIDSYRERVGSNTVLPSIYDMAMELAFIRGING